MKRSFWKIVDLQDPLLIDNYNGNGTYETKELILMDSRPFSLTTDYFISLAAKFQNLKKLEIISRFGFSIEKHSSFIDLHITVPTYRIRSWPNLIPEPWTSVKELHLDVEMRNANMFEDVNLPISFPNLTSLNLELTSFGTRHPIILPDLSGCERLLDITLNSADYWMSFQSNLEEKVRDISAVQRVQ